MTCSTGKYEFLKDNTAFNSRLLPASLTLVFLSFCTIRYFPAVHINVIKLDYNVPKSKKIVIKTFPQKKR